MAIIIATNMYRAPYTGVEAFGEPNYSTYRRISNSYTCDYLNRFDELGMIN